MSTKKQKTGTEKVRWDLSVFYKGLSDPRLEKDIKTVERRAKSFHQSFKGKLKTQLGEAITAYARIVEIESKVGYYLFLRSAVDTTDEAVKTKLSEADERFAVVGSEYLTFFPLEIISLPQKTITAQAKRSAVVVHHGPWIRQVRKDKPHVLSEEVESALSLFSPFGPSSWAHFFDEVESNLRFPFQGKEQTLTDMLHIISLDRSAIVRRDAQKVVNDIFRARFVKFSAQALNTIVGEKRVDDRKRGYQHPMHARNFDNMIQDEVVEALHSAVREEAAPLAREYYRLKGRLLKIKPLLWSDRNAPMPFADTRVIPYDEGLSIVIDAYERFSPTLADIVRDTAEKKHIDAPAVSGKQSGAFNASTVLPGGTVAAFTFLNYKGSLRDVMTLAHELGHGVHHIIAGEKQGILMQGAPMAYAETASVFGEMTTFNALKERVAAEGNMERLLVLLMGKLDDMVNTVVRQICFSEFERAVHNARRRLSPDELSDIWMDVTKQFYGRDGDVFHYRDMETLWCYVSHFHRPFYVYAYALGELFTQSLYAKQGEFGERFEPLYLDLLSAGGTKNAVELLKPFGLDPTKPKFWYDGIEAGLGATLREAKTVSHKLSRAG